VTLLTVWINQTWHSHKNCNSLLCDDLEVMMRCGKFNISSLFSRRLKLWICGGVSLIFADFETPMAHAQMRGSHGVLMQQQDGAMVSDLDNFDHLSRLSCSTAIALLLGLRRDADAAKLADENMMVGIGRLTGREHDMLSGLLAGSSNNEIARSLNLSEVTIKHHLKSLRLNLGTKNRMHAVCRAIEPGIS
jgi:DNA-binding CsgD family transcriptional regulator